MKPNKEMDDIGLENNANLDDRKIEVWDVYKWNIIWSWFWEYVYISFIEWNWVWVRTTKVLLWLVREPIKAHKWDVFVHWKYLWKLKPRYRRIRPRVKEIRE